MDSSGTYQGEERGPPRPRGSQRDHDCACGHEGGCGCGCGGGYGGYGGSGCCCWRSFWYLEVLLCSSCSYVLQSKVRGDCSCC